MTEREVFHGGMNAVEKIGDTVHRPVGPWTPTIHALLRDLRAAGFTGAPEPFGLDGDGHEVLSSLELTSSDPTSPRLT